MYLQHVGSPTISEAHAKENSAHRLAWDFFSPPCCITPEGDRPGCCWESISLLNRLLHAPEVSFPHLPYANI